MATFLVQMDTAPRRCKRCIGKNAAAPDSLDTSLRDSRQVYLFRTTEERLTNLVSDILHSVVDILEAFWTSDANIQVRFNPLAANRTLSRLPTHITAVSSENDCPIPECSILTFEIGNNFETDIASSRPCR
jgi:hypothetical protein